MPNMNFWLTFIILWITAFLIVWRMSFRIFISPVFWMGMGFLFDIGLYYTSGFDYYYKLRFSGLFYVFMVWLSFFLGFLFKNINKADTSNNDCHEDFLNQPLSFTLFCINLAGFLMFLLDFSLFNSFTISGDIHVDSVSSKFGVLGKIVCFLGVVIWLYNVYYAIKNNKRIKLYAFFSLFFFLAPNLAIAGRQSILLSIITTLIVLKISMQSNIQYRFSREYYILFILILSAFLFFSTVVAVNRTDINNKIPLFEYMFRCEITDKTINQLSQTGPFKDFFLEIISYYSHELPNFQALYDNWDYGVLWGGSQFQFLSRKFSADSRFSFDYMWLSLDDLHDYLKTYSHTWRTVAGNCLIDYGKIGGLFFMFICGYMSSIVYWKVIRNNHINGILLLALIDAGSFFCLQYSPFCELSWFYSIIWIIIGIPFTKIMFRKSMFS